MRSPHQSSSLRPRARAALVVAFAAVTLVVAACGIDADELSVGGSDTTGVATTEAGDEPTTTEDPGLTLPPIDTDPSDTTEPPETTEDTGPEPTDPPDTDTPDTGSPGGDETPNGVTADELATQLQSLVGLPESQAVCLSDAMFENFTGEEIDSIYEANDPSELPPELILEFTNILTECLVGG